MKPVKIKTNDWQISEYVVRVKCPYCGNEMNFYESIKFIDKTDYCTNCGKEFVIRSNLLQV